MTQQTTKLIVGVNFQEAPAVGNPTINWSKNHGKFIHEFTYKQSKKEILENVNLSLKALQANLEDTIELAKKAMSSLNQDIDNETERANGEEKRLQGDIDKLTKNLQEVIGRLDTLSNTVDTISSHYDSLNTRVSTLETAVQNLQKSPNN